MSFEPVTAAADPRRALPPTPVARLDAARAALASLAAERRRLERIGFEHPLARCADQARFWGFVAGLCSLAAGDTPMHAEGAIVWPAAPRR